MATPPVHRPLNALLGRGAVYEGDLSFEGRVRLDGIFRGRIYTDEVLEVGESGLIEGEVDADELVIAGTVRGKVLVRRLLSIQSTGRLIGEVDAQALLCTEGAVMEGVVRIGSER